MSIEETKEIDNRNYTALEESIAYASYILYKDYFHELSEFPVSDMLTIHHEFAHKTVEESVKLLKLSKVTCEKGEDLLQKLSTVYNSACSEQVNLLVLLDSQVGQPVDFYYGFSSLQSNLGKNANFLKNGFRGNLAGTILEDYPEPDKLMRDIMASCDFLASVSSSASLRQKSETEEKQFVQGIEKFIDTMQGEPYSAFFVASPMDRTEQILLKNKLETLYTQLSTFRKEVIAVNEGTSNAITESITSSTSNTEGITKTHTGSVNLNLSRVVGTVIGGGIGLGIDFITGNLSYSKSTNSSGGLGAGYSYSHSNSLSETETESNSSGSSESTSQGTSLQYEQENKIIENLLEEIDFQLKKNRKGTSYGLYRFAAYFLSNRNDTVTLAAHTYKSLMLGEGKETERTAVNFWNGADETQKENLATIKQYLSKGQHPIFENEGQYYDACTYVNGMELPIHMGIPAKSVTGLPVVEHARFGRSVPVQEEKTLNLGQIYHMGMEDAQQKVMLELNQLSSHTFITGSTGSGKSNTIYTLLEKLIEKNKHFLVVEPTKGEYKNVFGTREDIEVFVYGTNPNLTPMLRLNPFTFHEDIHVLEHIDRLVDIFNVCWPMYAAMPAILKEAIERAYIVSGWDLKNSVNLVHNNLFPTFADVLEQISVVINESAYSADNKGDYIGALSTRLRSLTNGINGLIFTQNDLSEEELFEKNVVVDLSRVGSMETKALIMGLLVMKLSEYYMVSGKENAELSHVTVLEEAHNLLKRTSTEQTSESGNLLGKSVEMLSNAIAEMRTYGEGFIIADQSPNMLDMSAIRNTNTKIIMKLPEESDRVLVGKSANLNDDQILELSKLKTGVAAVYQNNWNEPVLCQVDEYKGTKKIYKKTISYSDSDLQENLLEFIAKSGDIENITIFEEKLLSSDVKSSIKASVFSYLQATENKDKLNLLHQVAYRFFDGKSVLSNHTHNENMNDWAKTVVGKLSPSVNPLTMEEINLILVHLVREHEVISGTTEFTKGFAEYYKENGGVYFG